MKHKTKKILRNVVSLGFVAIVIIWVSAHFVHLGTVEWTDNAQVKRNIVPVNCRVQGYIKKINFSDFQHVKKGDTLVIIEQTEFKLHLAQAEANYKKALTGESAMGTVVSAAANNVSVSDAAIEELNIRLQQARKDYKRYEKLLAQKAVTREQYEHYKTNYEALNSRYNMLLRQKNSTRLVEQEQNQRKEQVSSDIEVAKAALDLAKLQYSYTMILAPCNGVTSHKNIQLGQLIQPGQGLLSIVEADSIWVIANYKETQTANIKPGMPVEVKVDAVPDITFKGEVGKMSAATGSQYSVIPLDNATGNFVKVEQRIPIRILFTDKNKIGDLQKLRSGMNVECEVNY